MNRLNSSLRVAAITLVVMGIICVSGRHGVCADDAVKAEDQAKEPEETLIKKGEPAAETEAKPASEANSEPPPAAENKEEIEKKPKAKPSLADRLLDDLIGQAKEQAGNPLDSIVERMRAAQDKLKKTETDQETRQIQAKIVTDLDELIEKIKNLKPPPPKSNQDQPPPMGQQDQSPLLRMNEQPKPQNSQKQQQRNGADRKNESTAGKTGDKSKESADRSNQQQARSAEEEAARQRLAKDIWGHLPPALRQQLLNVYSEKFLPKYDDLVRKYYEALAEQNRKNP